MSEGDSTKLQIYFYAAILLTALVLVVLIFLPYLTALVFAFVFALIFRPLYLRFFKHMPQHDSVAAMLVILVALIVVITPLLLFSFRIVNEAGAFYTQVIANNGLERGLEIFFNFLDESLNITISSDTQETLDFSEYAQPLLSWLVTHVAVVFGSVARFMINFVISMMAFFFLLKDGSKLRRYLTSLSPLPDAQDAIIMDRIKSTVNSVIRGVLVIAIIQGVIAGVGYKIFGVPNAVLWGGVTSVSALVPGIGTALVLGPAVLYLIVIGMFPKALGLAIWGFTAVGLIDNFLGPRLWGRGIRVPIVLILVSVLGGIQLFGPVGFILGPLILSVLFALLDIYPVLAKQ